MRKLSVIWTLAVALGLSFLSNGLLGAVVSETNVMDVGNQFCPVSGDKISGKHFVVHEGKRYGFCCPMCEQKFRKNPKKYIAIVEKQRLMPKAQESSGKPQTEQEHDHSGHIH